MNDIDRRFDHVFEELRAERAEFREELRAFRAEFAAFRVEVRSELQSLHAEMLAMHRHFNLILGGFLFGLLGLVGAGQL